VPELSQPREWSTTPAAARVTPAALPRRKSSAVWWVLGTIAVLGIIGIGFTVMLLALASMSSNSNNNASRANTNSRVANRNTSANANRANTNTTTTRPASFSDDFSEIKWATGNSQFGDIWYADDEYHMRSKEKTFLIMYAPSDDYNTENATVRVTVRSVDGSASTSGYGLIVHGEKNSNNELEDYAFLIYTGTEPQYEIVSHKGGSQNTLVTWTKSNVIQSGTHPNQLEVRIKGTDLTFYINGQYVNGIKDVENYKAGRVGFYTSDVTEVAFDGLEIQR
jgi:hypothetical protein